MKLDNEYPVTEESIARAKAARDAERREVERQTGCRITEEGQVIWPKSIQ